MNPCPSQIGWWFKYGQQFGKKKIPPIDSVEDFKDEWIQWWSAIQPQWRDTGDWLFTKEDTTRKDWGHLLDGGSTFKTLQRSLGWMTPSQMLLG